MDEKKGRCFSRQIHVFGKKWKKKLKLKKL
jgi:hypothetical protein